MHTVTNIISLFEHLEDGSILIVVTYFIISCAMSGILLFASYIANSYLLVNNSEKLSGYECGFDPFNDARDTFYIKFYLISILFIIFDIEIIYFFPWVISMNNISIVSFYTMTCFFIFLIIGFWYEWQKNVLDFD
jgi:NADH:ubiquinone oxidoreductase subunit 3 (subunit A)